MSQTAPPIDSQADVAENPIPRYRQILKKDLPEAWLKPDNLNLLWFIPHALMIGTCLWLLTAHFNPWVAPLLSLVIGHSMGCLGFLGHEICHGGGISNKKFRHLLAGIGFSAFAIGPHLWSRWHNAEHHGHTQVQDVDPDHLFTLYEYQNRKALKALHKLSPLGCNLVVFSFFCLLMSQRNLVMTSTYLKDPKTKTQEKATLIFQLLLPLTIWIGGTALLGWQVLLFGYVLPLLVANAMVIAYISTNHFLNPLADENDVLAASLSVTFPKWLGWLDALHLHFGAHVSHHLFPHAPSRYCRQIELRMQEIWPDRYHVMPLHKALKLLWNTPWIYDENGVALINPPRGDLSPTLGHGLEKKI